MLIPPTLRPALSYLVQQPAQTFQTPRTHLHTHSYVVPSPIQFTLLHVHQHKLSFIVH